MSDKPLFVFLDFDGVLHPEDDVDPAFFTRNQVFHKFLRACPAAAVVFSTTWRLSRDVPELARLVCQGGGEDLCGRFVGKTPDLDFEAMAGWREAECLAWLAGSGNEGSPWLAIDDHPEWFGARSCVYPVESSVALTADDLDPLLLLARSTLGV